MLPTMEEMQDMTPAERREHMQRMVRERKWCHRSISTHMLTVPTRAAPGLAMPGEQGQAVALNVQFLPGDQVCKQDECMLWDAKKRRCLDRSALIAQAYGKDEAGRQET